MTLNIRIDQNFKNKIACNKSSLKPHWLQSIPADIKLDEKDEEIDIDKYFTNNSEEKIDNEYFNSLRGRPLNGTILKVPKNHSIVVLQDGQSTNKSLSTQKTRDLRLIESTKSFTLWNFDKTPSPDDQIQKALRFIDIAQAIHG